MGDLHQENTDRSTGAGRPQHEPHHPRGHGVPIGTARQHLQDARRIQQGESGEAGSSGCCPRRGDRGTHHLH